MKLKPGFDDEFQPKGQRWSRPRRSIGWLMIALAVCSGALSVTAGMGKYKRSPRTSFLRAQRAVPIPQVSAPVAQASDPFVVVAAAEIDAGMIVVAPAEIDEAMVSNPESRDRQPTGAPVPGTPLIPVPGDQPGEPGDNAFPPPSPAPGSPR
jgi:hypothetical protein